MSDFRFELNRSGVRDMLRSEEMQNILGGLAEDVLNNAQSQSGQNGYVKTVYVGKNRANASVHAETLLAKRENSKNNTLLKALGSARRSE